MNDEMEATMKAMLKSLARRGCWDDDEDGFDPREQSGGNFHDAYDRGKRDGETHLAQTLLRRFFILVHWDTPRDEKNPPELTKPQGLRRREMRRSYSA